VHEKLQLFECGGRNAKYTVSVRKDMQMRMCEDGRERVVEEDRTQPVLQ
jgi:tRNA U54 and U55 pseudouridine synthase Pus10